MVPALKSPVRRIALLLLILGGTPATAEEIVELDKVLSAETLRLTDGRELRLGGISIPKGDLSRRAQAAIETLAKGALVLSFDSRPKNRYGQLLAQVRVRRVGAADIWLQQRLVSSGLARVGGLPENRQATPVLLMAEAEARAARRGLWAYRRFAVLSAEQAEKGIGRFQLVEGRVLSAKTVMGRTYLNFGEDWREDFTISLDRAAARRFKAAGLDPLAYEGRRVRVRGWLQSYNGPLIELDYPDWLEVLEP